MTHRKLSHFTGMWLARTPGYGPFEGGGTSYIVVVQWLDVSLFLH